MNEDYPHFQPVLSRPINWDLIRQQYGQIIKYATVSISFKLLAYEANLNNL
ncbi:Tn3 family transposase [Bacillus sp. ISL-4]|nr:Tn3 family transposase [Bacillus sp. ISL-4]